MNQAMMIVYILDLLLLIIIIIEVERSFSILTPNKVGDLLHGANWA